MDDFTLPFDPNDFFFEFDESLVRRAIKLAAEGKVIDSDHSPNMLMGIVLDRGAQYHPSILLENGQLSMGCDCPPMETDEYEVCEHTLALVIDWTNRQTGPTRPGPLAPPSRPASHIPNLWPDPRPEAVRKNWSERMNLMTVKEIRELAETFRVKLKGIKREEVLNGMLDVLSDPAQLQRGLERLQPDTRRLVDLLSAFWDFPTAYASSRYPVYLQKALENGLKTRPVKELIAELNELRLWQYYPGAYQLPQGVLALPWPNPHLFAAYPGQPARVALARPFQFTRLALRLVLLAQGGWLAPGPARHGDAWPNFSARRDAEIPIPAEPSILAPDSLDALQALGVPRPEIELAARAAAAAGLWQAGRDAAGKPKSPAPGQQFSHWLRLSPLEQSQRLFQAALGLPSSLELDLASQAGGFSMLRSSNTGLTYPFYLQQLAAARLRLARLLARVPAGQWIDLESILRSIHGLQPEWQLDFMARDSRSHQPQAPIWPVSGGLRVDTQDYLAWRKSYGQFHETILVRSFHWLGLLDVGYTSKDDSQAAAVRLTRFGETLLGRQPDFQAPPPAAGAHPLLIHPDGALELDPDDAPLELINLVVQIAQPEGRAGLPPAGGETPGPAKKNSTLPRGLRYRLDEAGLGLAFDDGWTLDQISSHLASASGHSLPGALLQRLRPLWERYGRLQLYEDLALVQFGDDYCLPELLANTGLSQILLYTFSPRLIAIRSEAAADFLAELQAKGYTPKNLEQAPKNLEQAPKNLEQAPKKPASGREDASRGH